MNEKKPKFKAGSPLSMILHAHLYNMYYELIDDNNWGEKINFYDFNQKAFYSFVISVNLWESILNEVFHNDFMKETNTIFGFAKESIEKWDIKTKTLLYPRLLLGRDVFDKSKYLWQKFSIIVDIRNNIIHYKSSLYEGPKTSIDYLKQQKYTRNFGNSFATWHMEINTSECVRFCINTIFEMIYILCENIEELNNILVNIPFKDMYKQITEEKVLEVIKDRNIDFNRINNPFYSE